MITLLLTIIALALLPVAIRVLGELAAVAFVIAVNAPAFTIGSLVIVIFIACNL